MKPPARYVWVLYSFGTFWNLIMRFSRTWKVFERKVFQNFHRKVSKQFSQSLPPTSVGNFFSVPTTDDRGSCAPSQRHVIS